MKWSWTVLLVIALLMLPVGVLAQDSLSQTFTSGDGSITIHYPEGWAVQEEEGTIILASSQDTLDADEISTGEGGVMLLPPVSLHMWFEDLASGGDPITIANAIIEAMMGGDGTAAEPVAITIGDKPGARANSSDDGTDILILVFFVAEDTPILFMGVTKQGEMPAFEEQFLAMAAAITYTAPPDLPGTGALEGVGGHTDSVGNLAYSPDGTQFATGSNDTTIKLWTPEGVPTQTLEGYSDYIADLDFSADGSLLASAGDDNMILLWDMATGEIAKTIESTPEWDVRSVAFSPDGTLLASAGSEVVIRLWDVSTGEPVKTLENGAYVDEITFSPDGTLLATADNSGDVHVWDVAAGALVNTLVGHDDLVVSIAFSPDGTLLASGSDDSTIKLWDVATGELVFTLEGHDDYVTDAVFSPDGTLLASSSDDYTVGLWDVTTGELIKTYSGHYDYVNSVAFSPDGKTIVSASSDQTIRFWDVPAE